MIGARAMIGNVRLPRVHPPSLRFSLVSLPTYIARAKVTLMVGVIRRRPSRRIKGMAIRVMVGFRARIWMIGARAMIGNVRSPRLRPPLHEGPTLLVPLVSLPTYIARAKVTLMVGVIRRRPSRRIKGMAIRVMVGFRARIWMIGARAMIGNVRLPRVHPPSLRFSLVSLPTYIARAKVTLMVGVLLRRRSQRCKGTVNVRWPRRRGGEDPLRSRRRRRRLSRVESAEPARRRGKRRTTRAHSPRRLGSLSPYLRVATRLIAHEEVVSLVRRAGRLL